MISSGCAAWPEGDTTYLVLSSVPGAGTPVDEGGRVDGRVLYVYGSVVAVGRETNGDTVNGTCASSGSGPVVWSIDITDRMFKGTDGSRASLTLV